MRLRSLLGLVPLSLFACSQAADDAADGARNAATAGDVEDDPGLRVSAGKLVIDRTSLGERVYRLASTAVFAKWDVANCGPAPADLVVEPPGDMPDTCFYKVLPQLTRNVTFTEAGDAIVMKEGSTELGSFPIARSNDEEIAFEFNPSVLHVKISLAQAGPVTAAPVRNARAQSKLDAGWVGVTQDGLLELAAGRPGVPARIKYGIAARRASKGFTPAFQPVGKPRHFFEINHPDKPIGKYDFTGRQIVKLRSIGVPPANRATATDALNGAIDYWNRVFRAASGERDRVFFAAESDDGTVLAHDPGRNVIQWSAYPLNSASMGVFQTDGLTGEILFSTGYISAGFFGAGDKVGARMYQHANGSAAPQATITRFTNDYMLATVAHEIGHMIGLQHHFRASQVANGRTPAELVGVARDYFAKGAAPSDISISVMEYLPIPLAGILGRRMRTEILPHDLDAIARGYYGKPADLETHVGRDLARKTAAIEYCNDDDGDAPGCVQFDHPLCAEPGAYCFTSEL
jgi:hypothetical protein